MIRYQLACSCGHEFEGWFRDSASFDSQAAGGLVSCPHCAGTAVHKRLMAPSVRTRRRSEPPVPNPAGSATPTTPGKPPGTPDELRAVLMRLRRQVEAQCDDLGDDFANEAIRIHHGEAPSRGIYGNATEADRERLEDEGVEIVALPWLKPVEN